LAVIPNFSSNATRNFLSSLSSISRAINLLISLSLFLASELPVLGLASSKVVMGERIIPLWFRRVCDPAVTLTLLRDPANGAHP